MLLEMPLADADGLGGDLHQLVVLDELQGLFQAEADGRGEEDVLVGAGGADVGELLGLEGVDGEVVVAGVDADHLALVHLLAGADQQAAALLEVEEGIAQDLALAVGDHGAVAPRGDAAGVGGAIVIKDVVLEAGAGGQGHELGLKADEAAGGDLVVQAHPALAVGDHVLELAAALAQGLHDGALAGLLHVHGQLLVGLADDAVDLAEDDLRAGDGQFVAFPAHVLQQDGQVQLAAAGDAELLRVGALLDTQGDVVDQLALQALLELARGQVLALAAGEGGAVDLEGHGHRGLVHRQGRQGLDPVRVAEGVGDVGGLDAGDGDDVPGLGQLDLIALQAQVAIDQADLGPAAAAVGLDHDHLLVGLDGATLNAAQGDGADEAAVVQGGDLHLEGALQIDLRCRAVVDDGLEEGGHVALGHVLAQAGVAVDGGGVDDGEVELLVGGPQAVEELEDLIDDPARPGAGLVDLVHHQDGPQAVAEGLLGDEAGLGHGAFLGVHQQQHRVDHGQHPLHLAAEVGVAGGVDDVDAVLDAVQGQAQGGVLGQDGDAPFPLQVVGVHDPLHRSETFPQGAGLLKQLVHQGGLAMVDMGDDGDVAEFFDHGRTALGV